jgi:hypothetical protein
VFLDFDSRTEPGEHVYTQAERDAIQASLAADFAAFSFTFTQDAGAAEMLAKPSGGHFVTIYFNDGTSTDGGGNSSQLDFGNRDRGGYALIDINGFLPPDAPSADFTGLTATVAAHELGHLTGLLHADSYGPIGSGIFSGVNPATYRPAAPGVAIFPAVDPGPGLDQGSNLAPDAVETPKHIMASPASVHTSSSPLLIAARRSSNSPGRSRWQPMPSRSARCRG